MNVISIIGIYLLARSLPNIKKFPLFPEICALFLAISPWYGFISQDQRAGSIFFLTISGVYMIIRFFKKYLTLAVTLFLLAINLLLITIPQTQDPIWLTDEQRREHGSFFESPLVILEHNKAINYSLSFLDHYSQHFQGDFLFITGDVRENFALMHLFDFIFVIFALIFIIKHPRGWGIIFVWLLISPLSSALDLQPPNALKSFNMIAPLVLLSSFGASGIIDKLKQ